MERDLGLKKGRDVVVLHHADEPRLSPEVHGVQDQDLVPLLDVRKEIEA
jgi:hypothetical protein